MNHQVQVPSLIGIIIIIIVATALFGGVFVYQYVSLLDARIVAAYPE
jgi:hypothetical protein